MPSGVYYAAWIMSPSISSNRWYAEGDVVVFYAVEALAVGTELFDTLKREAYLAERLLAGGNLDARNG